MFRASRNNVVNIVFMGSPDFAVPCLDALLQHHKVLAVVTQPDKPAGRGLGLQPPAVKKRALEAERFFPATCCACRSVAA
jgi:methionyl-tRNA formyltransferase